MWEMVATKIGLVAVERFFDRRNEDLDEDNPQVVSIGLAVGYYYNFLDPVSMVLRMGIFSLYASPEDKDPRTFTADDVRLQIILPGQLNVYAFQRCEADFKKYDKGFVFLPQNHRYYGINYFTTECGGRTELTILDLARPIMSAKRYYEDIVKLDTHVGTDPKWMNIQTAEITAFKESLRRLQKRGYGDAFVNKLDFRECN
ncbi:MAG: hypothetical protein E1N59_1686 [Puniceicoccaceae bacterium 5H]|nr:MAG: hypothetical protein E1N59_1686 [Puniceicoccaceae bacterium 5H]